MPEDGAALYREALYHDLPLPRRRALHRDAARALAEQGAVAGVITAANGISFVAAPAIGMALYAIDPRIPFAASALLLIGLAVAGRRGLSSA
mgnify:CR=1 FL=1